MSVVFHFQEHEPPLRFDGTQLYWVTVNHGDEASVPGHEVDILDIAPRAEVGPYQTHEVDTSPWRFEVPVTEAVEPGHAQTSAQALDWAGFAHGAYTATVQLQRGEHGVWAELHFRHDWNGLRPDHG